MVPDEISAAYRPDYWKHKLCQRMMYHEPAIDSALPRPVPPFASNSTTTSRGTTARSCKRRMPKEAFPALVPIWFLSLSSCSTNAEDERAKEPPMVTAAEVGSPSARDMPQPTAEVTRNCIVPSPKTSFFIAFKRAMDSSRPISKRKNTIPSSPVENTTKKEEEVVNTKGDEGNRKGRESTTSWHLT